jgi:DNA-directed RNA polymerase
MAVCRGLAENIESYAMIHDSFGTLAANTGVFSRCLREAFVQLYSDQDVLENMRQQMGAVLDEPLAEIPQKGELDLNQVIESQYFFA